MARRILILISALFVGLMSTACGAQPTPAETPQLSVESPWVRSTDDAKDKTMTAAFLTVVNPGNADVRLVKAATDAAGMTQLHEMVMVDGKKMMQEIKGGLLVPAGGHLHLVSGGNHIMLMQLKQELKIGEQVKLQLSFDNGTTLDVTAPVKPFVEETDHYHSPMPTPSS